MKGDRYDPDSLYGDGPPPGVLRADAPRLALVTHPPPHPYPNPNPPLPLRPNP